MTILIQMTLVCFALDLLLHRTKIYVLINSLLNGFFCPTPTMKHNITDIPYVEKALLCGKGFGGDALVPFVPLSIWP